MAISPHPLTIPTATEWNDGDWDLDVQYARRLLFGKSIDEVQSLFESDQSLGRAEDLLFMPRGAFQYYVFAYTKFLQSEAARGDSDAASAFLNLLVAREEQDSGVVAQIYSQLVSTIEFVASHQEYFDADVGIYGSFQEKANEIRRLCTEAHGSHAIANGLGSKK